MNETYDVIVVGGGVIGTSIAHYVSKMNKRVVVLEKNTIASGASSAAAGLLGVQAEWDTYDPLYDLARKSLRMFSSLATELRTATGVDIGYRENGIYKIACTKEEVERLRETMQWQQQAGEEAEWLSGEELRVREPSVSDEVIAAVYYPTDGHVLAPELTRGFMLSAARNGADIREYTDVYGLLIDNGKVMGVETNHGTFYGKQVVITAGAWSTSFMKVFHESYGTYPVKGVCVAVRNERPLLNVPLFKEGFYIVPKPDGRYIIGATVVPRSFDQRVESGAIAELLTKAKALVPEMEQAMWDKAWAGLRPQSETNYPYIGKHDDIEGLYACTGHYRNGILLSPISGYMMAELLDGNESYNLLERGMYLESTN
ncbi:glycine oxidase ThiO [Priestia taiwanensis]|uniref:Aerobic glycerol-3-phosphate dehydrogenase n=1 Tax=Priestia taiwanensis TaxID=1347902 RepID=A0A917AQM6_9BACI|nr:glycine oxidase ThiO [Priestia taiwanensis]MBM7363087.1 glycine oxidase [Priestia taiwanensis]GGE67593.1 glycine oxidase ThiO [Priestia taiwanensis]